MKAATQTAARSTAQTPYSNRGFDAQFLCNVPRHDPLILDGFVASIDSVRMKFTFSTCTYDFDRNERCDTLEMALNAITDLNLWNERLFDIETLPERNFKVGLYRNTIHYTHPDGWSFAVLAGRFCTANTANGSGFNPARQIASEAIMDFNPNKVPARAWERIAAILRGYAVSVTIQRYDLAIDFPLERSYLAMQERPGSKYQLIKENGAVTEYLGKRDHHAAIKLYDKAAELEIDTDCTRLEFTIDPSRSTGISGLFPTITSTAPLALSTDFGNLPFQVQAVLIHPDLFSVLKASTSRNTWAKYEKLIREYSQDNGDTILALTDAQCEEIDQYTREYLAKLKQACTII